MNKSEIKKHIIDFLSNKSTVESAKQYLIRLRHTNMDGYSSTESRCLWFSLFLYKFRHENNAPDSIWAAARKYILSVLTTDSAGNDPTRAGCSTVDPTRAGCSTVDPTRAGCSVSESARYFLNVFGDWKKEDNINFEKEVIDYYIQVLHLKQTIEETHDENTIGEWNESYRELLHKIRDCSGRMGFLSKLDEAVAEINRVQRTLVESMMKRAYWDLLEENIRDKEYTTVLCQLLELKNLIKEIIPARFHADINDKFSIEYIQDKLEKEILDPNYLVELCRWIMNSMKEWDSESTRSLYDHEIQIWEQAIETLEWPRFLRFSLELCTLLALDAKTRVSIWRSLTRESINQKIL